MSAYREYSDPTKAEVYQTETGWTVWCGPCGGFYVNSKGETAWTDRWFETWSAAWAALGLHAKDFHPREEDS